MSWTHLILLFLEKVSWTLIEQLFQPLVNICEKGGMEKGDETRREEDRRVNEKQNL